jgi:hypothetical protein
LQTGVGTGALSAGGVGGVPAFGAGGGVFLGAPSGPGARSVGDPEGEAGA